MPQDERQAQLPDGPPRTVERNPFRNPEYRRGSALAAPSRATNPFLTATPDAAVPEPTQTNAPAAPTSRQYEASGDGVVQYQEQGPVVNVEHVGIAITGINYGHVTQIDDFNVLRNLPIHPDISGHLSNYFPESRADDEANILQWIDCRHPPELVLCVLGKVGVGKSTLAKHLATVLEKDKRLAANIFLGFALPDWSAESVVRMAAGQLCGVFPTLTRAVCEAIRRDINPSVSLETRIQNLILEPIRSLCLPHPLVILLDALDQWAPHPILVKALTCLTPETHIVRFVVLGRPGLEDRFQNVSFQTYDLPDVVESVMRKYFRERFLQVQWEHGRKPSVETINRLVDKASGLFIWSSTLCSILEDELSCPKPHETVAAILRSQQSVDDDEILAKLYHDAINLRFPKADHKTKLKVFLGAVLALQEPIPIAAFASMVSMAAPTTRKILADLRPLQTGQMKDDQDMVHPASMRFHLSFLEYLQSMDTSPHLAFQVDIFASHSQLGKSCLEELRRPLSSRQPPFANTVEKYALRYWPTHIAHGTPSVSPTSDIEWKASPHCAILNGLSLTQWQFWSSTYLPPVHSGSSLEPSGSAHEASGTPTGDTPQYFVSRVTKLLLESPMAATIHNAIAMAEVAVRLQHRSADAWLQLGTAYAYAPQVNASLGLLDSAVRACRHAVDLWGKREHISSAMLPLAKCLGERFTYFGRREDLEEAISLGRTVMLAAPQDDPNHVLSLNNLAASLHDRFELTGATEALLEEIKLLREALLLWPSGHPDRALTLNNLANALTHSELKGTNEKFEEAIELLREALLLLPSGHRHRTMFLDNLANALHSQFTITGNVKNLEEALVLHREALMRRPSGHPDHALSLNNLAACLQSYYELTGAVEHLDESIILLREALSLLPSGHPRRAMFLNNLANSLQSHSELTSNTESLDEVIELLQEALLLWPPGHANRTLALGILGNTLYSYVKMSGNPEKLDGAIALFREALLLRPSGHPLRPLSLNNLANSLEYHSELTGATDSLDEALVHSREALSLWPSDHPDRASPLNILANSLVSRSKLTGSTETLGEAIAFYREALSLRPSGHPERALSLHNLAHSLHCLFNVIGAAETLDEAIILLQEALSLWPSGHPTRPMSLNVLGICLQSQFKVTGSSVSLDNALVISREALSLQPSGHPHRAASLVNVAYNLRSQFDLTSNAETLDEAIILLREAVSLCPAGHPHHATSLGNLALALQASHKLTGDIEVPEEADSLILLVEATQ